MAEGQKAIALPAVVDLDALDGVRDRLLDAIDSGPVTISAAAVERVCTNGLLMLISAAETARRSSVAFAVEEVSPAMRLAIERLGLGPHFSSLIKG